MSELSREERARVNDLVADALALPSERRPEFVGQQCSDERLCQEALRLLEQAQETATVVPGLEDRGVYAGTTVGRFRLLQFLGGGASGEVYLAVRLDVGQKAAVKILRNQLGNARSEKEFEQEARLWAGLDHPNIVRLLDYGRTSDGRSYLAMEHANGGNLRQWCDRHALSITERIRLFLKVCEAVEYAHDHLLVHRDLKPANILVNAQGEVKLVDFGIVQMLGPAVTLTTASETDAEIHSRVGGTIEFASPEQLTEGPITTASDVYGLGVVLYEILTGRVPLKKNERGSETIVEFIRRIKSEPAPKLSALLVSEETAALRKTTPGGLRVLLSGDLEAILDRTLAKSPSDRYANAGHLRDDLSRYLDRRPVRARQASVSYRFAKLANRHPYSLACGAAAVLFVCFASSWILRDNSRLSKMNKERDDTISLVMRAATRFESGIDELERNCSPDHARAALATAEARMQAEPTLDSSFHTASCRRIFAEVLLGSSNEAERKQGHELLERAKALLASIRAKDPNYGGLDDEWKALTADEAQLRAGVWTTSGIGFAAESVPPVLRASSTSYDQARLARRLGDLWLALGDPSRAAGAYAQAIAHYDEAPGQLQNAELMAERAECQRLIQEIQNGSKGDRR